MDRDVAPKTDAIACVRATLVVRDRIFRDELELVFAHA
jgi:hypothetical protein